MTHSNPLLQKYDEIYGKKEEPPEIVEEPKKIIKKLTTHDIDSINDSFLQIAEKIKNKEAQVCTMNIDYEHQTRTQRITFEVLTNF
jgi:hypothetical protein